MLQLFFLLRQPYEGHHWPMICKVLSIAISCHCTSRFPQVGYRNVVNGRPFRQLHLILLPEVKLVGLRSCRFPIVDKSIRQHDLVLRDPLHERALEFPFHFIVSCSVSTRHSCAVVNERPLVYVILFFLCKPYVTRIR